MATCGAFALVSCQHACKSHPTLLVASAHPCLKTNLPSIATPSGCNHTRGLGWKSSRLRSEPGIIMPSVGSQSEQESICQEESPASEVLQQQIIVPNLDSQRAEELLSEKESTLEAEPGDPDAYSEGGAEEAEDLWLLEFQKHLPSEADRIRETWSQVSDYSGLPRHTSRRRVLGAPMFMSLLLTFGWSSPARLAHAVVPAKIDLTQVPKSSQFSTTDMRLRDASSIFRQALDASTVEEEENLWTKVIDSYGQIEADWVPDILARALGNRGNARCRQGLFELALGDYNRSIALAPYAVDPVLNRGVALETLGRLDEASADYEAVLQVQPEDPAAWNNLGNVKAALSQWDDALRSYFRAVQLAPKFSFAAANYALALYQVGRDNEAVRQFRNLLRKYPEFSDVRAALAISLYEQGLYGEAETNWGRLEDGRYKNRDWVRDTRRWPPRLTSALEDFLDVKQKETKFSKN